AFYEAVLGWQIDKRSSDDVRFSDRSGLLIGRFAAGKVISREPGFVPYLYVDGIDAAIARVVANGGEIVRPIYPEGDLRAARVRDPAGNLLGLWQVEPRRCVTRT